MMQAILVTFDHLAATALGCYGNTSVRTPNFDRFAAGSVVFDQCVASLDPAEPVPGLADLVRDLRNHGGHVFVHDRLPDNVGGSSLQEALTHWQDQSAAAHNSLLWLKCSAVSSPWRAASTQFAAVWKRIQHAESLAATLSSVLPPDVCHTMGNSHSPEALIDAAMPHLDKLGVFERDHRAANPPVGRLRRAMYVAAVEALDSRFGEWLPQLESLLAGDSLTIIAAAQGDLTGPHPELAAGCPPLIGPLLHVPLLIRTGTAADGTRRGALVTTADITPTLRSRFALEQDAVRSRSHSLEPLLRNEIRSLRDELLTGDPQTGWRLQTQDFACICGDAPLRSSEPDPGATASERPRLFIKPDDSHETLDTAREYPDVVDDMLRRIGELTQPATEARVSSAETEPG